VAETSARGPQQEKPHTTPSCTYISTYHEYAERQAGYAGRQAGYAGRCAG
jgi:hypothetical protein